MSSPINSLHPKRNLYLVTVGNSDHGLIFPDKDGRGLDSIMESFEDKGGIKDVYIDSFYNKKATKENILSVKSTFQKSDIEDEVIIAISGHGILSDSLDFYYAATGISF